jgi:glycosyltransferase involved in cell wall biosynthesis
MVKRVLLLLPGAFSGYGGIEMFNRLLVRAFLELGRERGFAVRSLILNDWEEDVDDRYIPRGAECPKGYSRRKLLFAAAALRSALSWLPDLVVFGHIHFARLAQLVEWLSPASRHWYVVYGIEVWRPLPLAIRQASAKAERILSISDFTRRELARNGGPDVERVDLLPCALDPVWQNQHAPRPTDTAQVADGPPTLLTVARLDAAERYKGVDTMLRALPAVVAAFPDVRYEVVGDGDDRPRLERLVRELGLSERVHFRGRLGAEDLATAYRNCTVYVMPSSHEGFGIVFLEAALFGKPSIGGRHGGTPEVIQDGVTGLLVTHGDEDALSVASCRLLQSGGIGRSMGIAAREILEKSYTYRVFRSRVEEHLERAMRFQP